MSCQINQVAQITDIGAIRRCLFPTDDSRGSDIWLQLCEISVSPTGDIIAIANERRLVILSVKWDSVSSINQFQVTFSGSIHESDNVRAVACIPVVAKTKSSHVIPDFTCILIGYESGYVRFYTEDCDLLLEEQLHNESITSIKCRSQHNPRPDFTSDIHSEEIYVQYQTTVCVLPGDQLFPLLRVYRRELAQVQAKGGVLELSQGLLNPKKWGFQDQATVNDVAVVGANLYSIYDHLLTVSTSTGFETRYRPTSTCNKLVLAAGSRPFVGYHYAYEGFAETGLSDVAKVVASKLKSALPGWLGGGRSAAEKQMTVAMEPSENLDCRFGLCDLRRTAINIVLSPDHKLAAVSDALGRVLLIDAYRGITLKIFKGYRDAQCSFTQVPDEKHSKPRIGNKVAHFLIIYSPKKGTLEIFTVQQGNKVTTFSASKCSRLIYNNYNLMGFKTATKSKFTCQFDTVLIDNDGKVKEIVIPFHFALSEKNNKRARDIHFHKRLRQLLKRDDFDPKELSDNIVGVCSELQTTEFKLRTLELLIKDKTVQAETILKCVQKFMENIDDDGDSTSLKILSENVKLLLDFYVFTKNQELDSENGNDSDESGDTKIHIEVKHLVSIQKLLDLGTLKTDNDVRVGFRESQNYSASQFLEVFDLTQPDIVQLKESLDEVDFFKASERIFEKYIAKNLKLDDFEERINMTKLPTNNLFLLLIHYWIHRPIIDQCTLEDEMNNLYNLIKLLVNIVGKDEIKTEYNASSLFWDGIRKILANSSKPFPALTAAIVCKQVEVELDEANTSLDESMEILTQENVEWSLLIGKLEDISLLDIILSNKLVAKFPTLPQLKRDKINVSLKYVLENGRGSVSEMVARWLCMSGINPENIIANDMLLRQTEEESNSQASDSENEDMPKPSVMPQKIEEIQLESVLHLLNLLKTQFPYSLQAGVLLSNMCWEYALAWQKNIEDLKNLEACIECLFKIPSSHIREGLFYMVWNTHLKIIFENTCTLINKVGKLPKERLCRQDTGLSDGQVLSFLEITTNFLDKYMDAVQQSYQKPKPQLHFEQIWDSGPESLEELALQQNPINYDLLHLHYQLSVTLNMLNKFSVKHSKPINSLFETYMLDMFFADFQKETPKINWEYADERVKTSRIQFLCKLISASIETINMNENRLYMGKHTTWMEKFFDLGGLWHLDIEFFRRYECIQVYIHGFDSYANELYYRIADKKKLGPDLLVVAAKRLNQFLATSPNYIQNVTAFVPSVTLYAEQFKGEWCAPCSLEALENVAKKSFDCLEADQYEYKHAEYLLYGVQILLGNISK